MKTKLTIILSTLFLLIFLFTMCAMPPNLKPKEIRLEVVKDGNVWKVKNITSPGNPVIVQRNDKIIWTVKETDAFFQFPDTLFNPVDPEDSLKNGYSKFVKDGKELKLKVKLKAKTNIYVYAVFCTADGVFAEGDSPPKIIVE